MNKNKTKPKLCIIGHKRHGKDSLAEAFRNVGGYKYSSSSEKALELFLFDKMKDKYGYKTIQDAMDDKENRRAEWFDAITEFNKDDPARLAKEIMKDNDIYVGMRSSKELQECKRIGLFDEVIWVKRDDAELESSDSFDISEEDADIIISNNYGLDEYEEDLRDKAFLLVLLFEFEKK